MALTGVGRLGRRLALVLVVAVAFGGAAHLPGVLPGAQLSRASAAEAATTTIVIQLGGVASGFSPSSVTLAHGDVLRVVNKDTMVHTVTSVAVDAAGDPLFDLVVAAHATGTLVIPETLGAGKYSFYCMIHPNMQGTLVVTGEGGGVPEPPAFEQALRIPEWDWWAAAHRSGSPGR